MLGLLFRRGHAEGLFSRERQNDTENEENMQRPTSELLNDIPQHVWKSLKCDLCGPFLDVLRSLFEISESGSLLVVFFTLVLS